MSYDLTPLHPLFAVEVKGYNAVGPITDEMVEFLEDTMAQYAVVVLPNQELTDDQQIEFAGYFGPRETPASAASGNKQPVYRLPKYLFDASNLGIDNEILPEDHPRRAMRNGDRLWHTDSSFNPLPTKWSMLHGRIIPPDGGDTEFADTRAAYDDLEEEVKAQMENLVVEHSLWHSRRKGGFDDVTPAHEQSLPPAYHKLVRVNPRSGRKCFITGAHARYIPGLSEDGSEDMLQALTNFATQEKYIYVHKWRTNDLVIWDNRCTLHRGTPYDDITHKRDMRRTTIDEFAPSWSFVA
jgi:alpha-ketoglutarate-dependent 2,4-dichlorophenoxyacetate dioxygenase